MSFIGIDSLSRKLVPLRPDFGGWSKLLFDFTLAEASLRSLGKHMGTQKSIVPREKVERHILFIRGQKVLLDSDLAEMYGVPTKRLNEAVKRNLDRFPDDFMFQLTVEEAEDLKSQFATSSSWGGRRRSHPYAFTEQGVAMLSSVLRSRRAVQVNVQIMRTFVRLRELLSSNAAMARKLEELERKYDGHFKIVFDAIRSLMQQPGDDETPRKRIGYATEHEGRHSSTRARASRA